MSALSMSSTIVKLGCYALCRYCLVSNHWTIKNNPIYVLDLLDIVLYELGQR